MILSFIYHLINIVLTFLSYSVLRSFHFHEPTNKCKQMIQNGLYNRLCKFHSNFTGYRRLSNDLLIRSFSAEGKQEESLEGPKFLEFLYLFPLITYMLQLKNETTKHLFVLGPALTNEMCKWPLGNTGDVRYLFFTGSQTHESVIFAYRRCSTEVFGIGLKSLFTRPTPSSFCDSACWGICRWLPVLLAISSYHGWG